MRTILFAGLLALSSLGCSSDPANDGPGATGNQGGGGASAGAGGGASSCEPSAAPDVVDVSGRWAYRSVGSQLTQAAGLDPIQTRIVSVMLFTQEQSGDAVSVNGEYCDHYAEDPDAIVHAVIPDTYREALKPVTREGTFAAAEGGRRYKLPRLYEVVGATLANLEQDELPTEPTDERVVDQDGDGRPGMTLRLTGLVDGEVYVAERKWTEVDGVAVSADRIEGLLAFTSEQSVLDADPPSIKASTAASKTLPDPETCNSTFQMVRIPDDADCAWVKEQADTLFQ